MLKSSFLSKSLYLTLVLREWRWEIAELYTNGLTIHPKYLREYPYLERCLSNRSVYVHSDVYSC